MRTVRGNSLALVGLALGASILGRVTTVSAENIYVTKTGVPDPAGWWYKPYHMVESAIAKARRFPASTILIGPGKYYETFTIDTPCTLKSTGGAVTIGKMDYQASTTLDIVTLNTHLFGDVWVPFHDLTWRDCERSNDIIAYLKAMEPDMPDVIAFQEIWDEDFFLKDEGDRCYYDNDGDGDFDEIVIADSISKSLVNYAGYPADDDDVEDSGLAIMSLHYLQDSVQVPWDALGGNDAWTDKGYMKTRIYKSDFHIVLFNLHAQAGWEWLTPPSPDAYFRIREAEMEQLAEAIMSHRQVNPHSVVFVMGDFNIYSDHPWRLSSGDYVNEYYDTLIPPIGIVAGGKDAARNSVGFVIGSSEHHTYSRSKNRLAEHFDDESPDGRLDYIFYFPSLDGRIEVLPTSVELEKFRGEWHSEDGLTTNESSDHWGLRGKFRLIRTK